MVEKDSSQSPDAPERIGGHELLDLLGQGPRGTVHLGKESDDAAPVAVKILTVDPVDDPDFAARLKSVTRVSSSYVARTLDAGVEDGRLYVVREHVEGRSLAEAVAADGPLTGDALERVAVGMLTALTAVHLAGFAHRGLTPDNVILTGEGLRVTDIEIGDPAGEIGYRAPEQINGLQYGPYADVFAWAATVTFAATGSAPFGQDAHAVLTGTPEVDGLPEPLRQVVLAGLAKDVSGRPTTYTALLRLLGDANAPMPAPPIEGVPVPPEPPALATLVDNTPEGQPPVLPLSVEPADPTHQVPTGPEAQGPMGPEPMHVGPMGPDPIRPDAMPPVPMPPVPMQAGPMGPEPMHPGAMPPVPMQGGPMGPEPMHPGAMPPVPMQGGPMGPEPMHPGAMPPVPMQAGPMGPEPMQPGAMPPVPMTQLPVPVQGAWGPPSGPPETPAAQWGPSAAGGPAGAAAVRRPFPIGLAAGVVAVMVLSGVGLWGASEYSSRVTFEPAAAASAQARPDAAGAQQAVTGAPTQPQAEVTAPWAATPSPEDDGVGPLVLPSDAPTDAPEVPVITTVPTPVATQPVVVPTVVPTTAAPTVQAKKQTTKKPKPTATVTKTVRPTPTPTPTPTEKPTTEQPAAKPTTQKPADDPAPAPTKTSAPAKTTAPPAAAKKNPYTPTQVCGSGFAVQRSGAFNGGTTYQLYNNSTGQNCVVTIKSGADVGKATPMSATLEVQGGESRTDSGNFEYYAGPVRLPAKGKCVRFSGSAGSGNTSAPWGNCG